MAFKKKDAGDATVELMEIRQATVKFCVLGKTPLCVNRLPRPWHGTAGVARRGSPRCGTAWRRTTGHQPDRGKAWQARHVIGIYYGPPSLTGRDEAGRGTAHPAGRRRGGSRRRSAAPT
jgi:hypothetical protein